MLPGPSPSQAEFSGNLDITALGGAGFASQRTGDGAPGWDLSGYDALVLDVARADARKYTLTLKDEVLPRRPDGRDQSTVSWEYDFVVKGAAAGGGDGSTRVVIPFGEFQPTYRGKPRPDAEPLDLKNVKRFSFMMRRQVLSWQRLAQLRLCSSRHTVCQGTKIDSRHLSFFAKQEGDFSIVFNTVAVEKTSGSRDGSIDSVAAAKPARDDGQLGGHGTNGSTLTSWFGRLCGWGR